MSTDAVLGSRERDEGATLPEWLGEPTAAHRGRVVRDGAAPVQPVHLPTVEEVTEPEPEPEEEPEEPEEEPDGGGDKVAWALAYRRGLEEGRAAGHAEGLEEGRREGYEAARDDAVARYDEILRALREDAARHLEELDAVTAAIAAQATELAFAVAETVIGRELAIAQDPGADAVRRALAAVGGPPEAVARLHPDDLERLSVTADDLAPGSALQLVPDDSLEPGDCVLEAGAAEVDATIAGAVARVRAALGAGGTPATGPEVAA